MHEQMGRTAEMVCTLSGAVRKPSSARDLPSAVWISDVAALQHLVKHFSADETSVRQNVPTAAVIIRTDLET